MQTVMCYGDSNTWGANPTTYERYPMFIRWTGVLATLLGNDYHIIEEGLPGRTTVWNDPVEGVMSGLEYLKPCLQSHYPVDIITIMLGTNDLKHRYAATPSDIALGVRALVNTIRQICFNRQQPKMLIMVPPPIFEVHALAERFRGGAEKSEKLFEAFSRIDFGEHTLLMNAGDYITSSGIDGVHFDQEVHAKLAQAVADAIEKLQNK